MSMLDFMHQMVARNASDLLLSVGSPPAMRIDGTMIMLGDAPLESRGAADLANSILDDAQRQIFATRHEMNFTVDQPHVGRFRISLYRQRGEPAMAVRYIPHDVPSLDSLRLPACSRI